ncbi:hypothetical protein K1719_007339 [Acacia pycnantha]|nr:hypothetical protein K1719_007339 [Acacia pycnantha]
MPNGSLDSYLCNDNDNKPIPSKLTWQLGDIGLARLVSHEKGSRTTLVAGTRGYVAPEYVFTGKIYKESDIYSFGVVLLEMATGRKAVDVQEKEATAMSVAEWVWGLYGKGKVGDRGFEPCRRVQGGGDGENVEGGALVYASRECW